MYFGLVEPMARFSQSQFVSRGKNDGAWICTVTKIKLARQQQYLGATLSYSKFERQTMMARPKAGEKTSQQLTRWLRATKGFNTSQKFRLWCQCVFACVRYGLISLDSLFRR